MTLRDGKPCKKCGTSDWYSDSTCKECSKIRRREWGRKNRDRATTLERTYRHTDKGKKKRKEYRERYKEHHTEYYREWQRNNKDKLRAIERRRVARKKEVEVKPYDFGEICQKYGNICLCCKKKRKLTVDHVIPISLGGGDVPENIQPLCRRCNSSKGVNTTDYRPVIF